MELKPMHRRIIALDVSFERIGIIGAGQMGNGIAQVCAVAGLAVTAFGDDDTKRRQWQAFLKKSHIARAAGTLPETIALLHTLLWPANQVAGSRSNANAAWKASERQWR
jgi:3-hydroxyisobutyrate dehydrogenase-like beta-hydroxyacid dehydrogenase